MVGALFGPAADELEVAMEKVASEFGHVDWVEDPWLSLDLLGPQNPHFPTWLPEVFRGQKLSFQQKPSWFDELLEYYGCPSSDSELPDDPPSRQLLAIKTLILMYQAQVMATLPPPSFLTVTRCGQIAGAPIHRSPCFG